MSFADPQTISSFGGFTSLPRTGAGLTSGTFSSADGTILLSVSSSYGKRVRRSIRLTQSKISTDPLNTNFNVRNSASWFVVCDAPLNGFSVAELKTGGYVLTAYLTASTGARWTQLLGGES